MSGSRSRKSCDGFRTSGSLGYASIVSGGYSMRASSPGIRPEKTLGLSSAPTPEMPLFEDAFENAPQPMAIISSGGSIVRANRSMCQMLGFSRGELQALSCAHITHPEDFSTESEQRRRLAAADIGGYELVLRYVRKIGDAVWVRVAVAATRHGEAGETYLVATMEPAQAPDFCRPAKGDWRRGQFGDAALAAVHEIGNSLTPLMLNVEMILEHAKKQELKESAQQIFKAARRIAFTLRRLRGIEDGPSVADGGVSRMLDLRLIEPGTSLADDVSETDIQPDQAATRVLDRGRHLPQNTAPLFRSHTDAGPTLFRSISRRAGVATESQQRPAGQPGRRCVPRLREAVRDQPHRSSRRVPGRQVLLQAHADPNERRRHRRPPTQGNDYLCGAIGGVKAPTRSKVSATDSKETLMSRLRETFLLRPVAGFAQRFPAGRSNPFFGGRRCRARR